MSRPYFKKRIQELEEIFAGARGDRGTLRALRDELQRRKTRRAVVLLEKVTAALDGDTPRRSEPTLAPPATALEPPGLLARRGASAVLPRHPPSKPPITDSPAPEIKEPASPGLAAPAPSVLTTGARREDRAIPAPDADALLAAWTTLEVLEPQPLPKPEELEALGRRMIRAEEDPEPWGKERYGPGGRQREVYWFVYLGELNLTAATDALLRLFPDDSPEKPRPTRGTTTMAVVVLDQEGRPAEGKTFLSSFAWGYGKVRAGELRLLADFPQEEGRLCQELEQRLIRMNDHGEVLPVTAGDLERVTRWLVDRLGLPADEVALDPVYVRVPVWGRAYEAPEPELLNSFFLEDLARVRSAFRSGQIGPALAAFLSGEPTGPRADVRRAPGIVEETAAPGRIPLCRWPVRGRYPLVMMQQAAVNHAAYELSAAGLVGINGPPGTGKTTLLRDVVAKVVLDRAVALAAFEDPEEAFTHVTSMSAGRGFVHLYELDESLLGHELVVASSNNKAVENVSREIPGIDAVADDVEPPLRYFPSIADRTLGGVQGEQELETGRCWGLAAAVLGNAANRRAFADAFWWDPQRSMQTYLRGIAGGWDPAAGRALPGEGADDEVLPEVLLLEDAPRDRSEALERWRTARKQFHAARKRAEGERRRLETVRQALQQHSGVEEELEAVGADLDELQRRAPRAAREVEAAEGTLERARRRRREAVADRDALQSLRPGFLARLFRTRSFWEWHGRMAVEVAAAQEARRVEQAAEETWHAACSARDDLEARRQSRETERQRLERRLYEIRALLAEARSDLGERLPDRHFRSLPETERQKLSPWLSERFQAARDDLFAACFQLHRAFIDAAAARLRHNLGAAMMLLKGRQLTTKQEPARRSLWASLFLVVPVVSTTFASVSRMFGSLGREQLGWLLIDEAGQAVPQAAVGAIWRSRRVIGIGDPMQIQPVVAMPQRLVNAILAEHEVDPDAWAAPRSSVQSLADRASWFGTTLLQEEGDVWVGSPLRVHRRCEEPMFRISNQIAYDGLMVQATPAGPSRIGEVLGDSGWFHVEGAQPGHWSPAEGEVAAHLLQRVLAAGIDDPEIFFITPFRLVQAHLRKRLRQVVAGRTSLAPWRWEKENVGTIHTFQGKEAEAVILVLGAPSPPAVGARRWAGGEPNLLNVAASRAKRRLYVIGDRRSWREAGVFRTLAAHLPEKAMG